MLKNLKQLITTKIKNRITIWILFLIIIIYIYNDRLSKSCYSPNENTFEFKEKKTVVEKSPQKELNYSSINDWIEVKGSKRDLFLYSAYYDNRQENAVVRVIAVIKKDKKERQNFSCQVWTTNGNRYNGKVEEKYIHENRDRKYTTAFLLCTDFKLKEKEIAEKIAIATENDASLKTFLEIKHFPSNGYEGNFSVCVQPFHHGYNKALWFIEFIELHRILGAEKFYFYKYTLGDALVTLLQYYIKQGIVEVFPWSVPVTSEEELRVKGILAALNDCNLRNVGRYRYTIIIDVDEYIIPRKANNYDELIRDLGDYSSYVFQNVFFYVYFNDDKTISDLLYGSPHSLGTELYGNESEGPYLLTAYKTTRLIEPHNHGDRSKFIVKPEKAIECGNHFVWELTGNRSVLNVNQGEALSHHYRICEYGGFDCLKFPHTTDATAHKWLLELFRNVANICSQIYENGNKCPKAPFIESLIE